jgi:carbon storage regulator
MLILSRRVGKDLIIDKVVKVNVLGVNGNQIRIGIDAPRYVSEHREEMYKRIHQGVKKECFERELFYSKKALEVLTSRAFFVFFGSSTRTRTWDPLINSQLLYQLSYRGIGRGV